MGERCGICGSEVMFGQVIDFGEIPLANDFQRIPNAGKRYPLRIGFCDNCYSVQVMDKVDPGEVFTDEYAYFTSASKPAVAHFARMAEVLSRQYGLQSDDLIVEIGGNDGTFLKAMQANGFARVLNIEPCQSVARMARMRGIVTVTEPFKKGITSRLAIERKVRMVVANNVMAHIADLPQVFEEVTEMLCDNGLFVFEVAWLGGVVRSCAFDQFYHEHIYTHSLKTLQFLIEGAGLHLWAAELHEVHGQSLRVICGKQEKDPTWLVRGIFDLERELKLYDSETFRNLGANIGRRKNVLRDVISSLQHSGGTVAGYGAPAKATLLLNYVGQMGLEYVTDTTPAKQGRYIAGTSIQVVPPGTRDDPDFFILFAWNYARDILKNEIAMVNRGVRFIVPIPQFQIM